MQIEVQILNRYGRAKVPVVYLTATYDNRYILCTGNYIDIEGVEYYIEAVKGCYEEGELIKVQVKVRTDNSEF